MKENWDNAWSIESYTGESSDLTEVGRQQSQAQIGKEYIFYRDKSGNIWYRTEYRTPDGNISEYEYIFGHKPKKRKKKTS